MNKIFEEKIKTGTQIKTKDQNFKKKHYRKKEKDTDLLSISQKKIT